MNTIQGLHTMFFDEFLVNKLTVTKKSAGKEFVIVRPGLTATYYLAGSVVVASARIADAVSRYIAFVGPEMLGGYLANNGTFKVLTPERVERDCKIFRAAGVSQPGPDLEYASDASGSVGAYGLSVRGADNDDNVFPRAVSLLRYEFPHDVFARFAVEDLAAFLVDEAARLSAQCGTFGWGLKRAVPFAPEATKAINALLPRFIGLDSCYAGFGRQMRGRTPSSNWITVVDTTLFNACGGDRCLAETAPTAGVQKRNDLVALRGAVLPPVGDISKGASDLQAIPDVARFLAPCRVTIGGLGDKAFDAAAWLARFDGMAARAWSEP